MKKHTTDYGTLLAETPGEDTTSQLWRQGGPRGKGEFRMVVMALPEGGAEARAPLQPGDSPRVWLDRPVQEDEARRFFAQASSTRYVEEAQAFSN